VSLALRLGGVRKAALVLLFVGVFLTVGVPRWLAQDAAPAGTDADASFATLCRDHGGTPRTAPGSSPSAQAFCTVRYGGRVYRMDAITPDGFDADTASFQRQGCEEADRQAKAATADRARPSFVYHPQTGVCERRP
jgi:hypothetical protein